MGAGRYDFTLEQGGTFNPTIRYSQSTFTKKSITAVTKSGRADVTATAHGLTTDWSVYVVGLVGMDLLNHQSKDLSVPAKAYEAHVVDANTLELEVDTSRFPAYVSGGELLYRTPFDFTGYTARMQIRTDVNAAAPITGGDLTTTNGGLVLSTGVISPLIADTVTSAIAVGSYVYDLELVSGAGVVVPALYGSIIVARREVTR